MLTQLGKFWPQRIDLVCSRALLHTLIIRGTLAMRSRTLHALAQAHVQSSGHQKWLIAAMRNKLSRAVQ